LVRWDLPLGVREDGNCIIHRDTVWQAAARCRLLTTGMRGVGATSTNLWLAGAIVLIEPDLLPVSVAEPAEVRQFWDGWRLGP
jgi:hypothetical protein